MQRILSRAAVRAAALLALGALGACGGATRLAEGVAGAVNAARGSCSGPQMKEGGRENLGTCVNSEYADINPQISPDGRTLFFDRKDAPGNAGGAEDSDDIWYSTLQPDGGWGPARNLGAPLNNRGPNFVAAALPDGNTLLVGGTYRADGSTGAGVSLATRTRDGWGTPVEMRIPGLQNRSNFVNYYLSQDGQALLMSIKKDGGRGDRDLWVSRRQGDGPWSEPVNLGPTINTDTTEASPFLASDGVTLYFSSAGHGGEGERDLFITRRLDESWTNWSRPQNLGANINTSGNDAGFVISASGDYAYFTSNADSYGRTDIYRTRLPENLRPRPVVLVRGRVLDARTRQPLEASVVYEGLGNAQRGIARSNAATGEYQIVLPAGARFGFRGEAPRYYPENVNVDLSGVTAYAERTQDLLLVPLEVGSTVRLNNIFFDVNRATLRPESALELDRLADYLRANPTVEVEIGGHTDNTGTDEANRTLSQARARAVAEYLAGKGIAARRVQSRGYGESAPTASNDTDEGRQQNRRVEFKVIRL
jgi:OOP family OmpA-OmpF porin